MLRKKNGQLHQSTPDPVDAAEKALLQQQVRRKSIVVIASFMLLIAVVIIGTMAWYTRISNVTGMTMDVAEFDFNANYVEEDFIVSVDEYLNVASKKAAPGTGGVIPIRLSTETSEVAANYSISLDFSEMADEFRNRIRFFYYTKEGESYVLHNIDPKNSLNTDSAIKGQVNYDQAVYEYIFWEWVYTLDGDGWFGNNDQWYDGTTEEGRNKIQSLYPTEEALSAAQDAFDAFDTKIGLGQANDSLNCHYSNRAEEVHADEVADGTPGKLFAYQKAMVVKLNITGVSAEPKHTEDVPEGYPSIGTSVYYVAPAAAPEPTPEPTTPAT